MKIEDLSQAQYRRLTLKNRYEKINCLIDNCSSTINNLLMIEGIIIIFSYLFFLAYMSASGELEKSIDSFLFVTIGVLPLYVLTAVLTFQVTRKTRKQLYKTLKKVGEKIKKIESKMSVTTKNIDSLFNQLTEYRENDKVKELNSAVVDLILEAKEKSLRSKEGNEIEVKIDSLVREDNFMKNHNEIVNI